MDIQQNYKYYLTSGFENINYNLLTNSRLTYQLREYSKTSKYNINWSKLNGWNWRCLLIVAPQFSEYCNWNKLDSKDWIVLLEYQIQFAEFCNWSKLKIEDFESIIITNPKLIYLLRK